MIENKNVRYKNTAYWMSSYIKPAKVEIIKLLSNDVALVKRFSDSKEYLPVPVSMKYIYDDFETAKKNSFGKHSRKNTKPQLKNVKGEVKNVR